MEFTNCHSERMFSIQHYLQRTKRNIKMATLSDYLYLAVNKVEIPENDEIDQLYHENLSQVIAVMFEKKLKAFALCF